MLYSRHILGRHNTHILSTKQPTRDQINDCTSAQLYVPDFVVVVTYRAVGESLVTEAEKSQRQLHHHAHLSMHEGCQKLETWRIMHSLVGSSKG